MQTEDIQAAAGLRTSRLCILGLGALEGDKIIRTSASTTRARCAGAGKVGSANKDELSRGGREAFFICTTLPENAAHT